MSCDDSSDIRIPEVGEFLRLADDLGDIPAGLYVAMEVDWLITRSRLGENEDGDMCTTCRTCKVTFDELPRFETEFLILPL